jgi:hypothetical protein
MKATMKAAEVTIPGEGRISKDWFRTSEDELLKAIGQRNYWFEVWTHTSISGARTKLKEARKELRNQIKEAKIRWHEKRAEEIHKMKFNPKSAWKAIREIQEGLEGHHTAPSDMKMKLDNGELAKSDSDNADVMSKHFEKVFNNHRPIDLTVLDEIDQRETIESLGDPPTTIEIEAALRKIPNGKAPGESGITPEALKAFDDEHVYMLKTFLTKYWTSDDIDYDEWHRNTLCALRKPGNGKDYSNPNNWRGICLAEIPAKVQSSIISTRLLSHLELVGIETQYGCVPGKGCTDALFAIKNALQMRKQHGKETWAVFVDLVKAFDTADHQLLFAILKKYGIPSNLVKVIEKMYKDSVVIFKTGVETREIPYKVGVKQGDNMAPILFIYLMNAFAETLSKKWTFKKLDYNWFPESKNGNKRGRLTGQDTSAAGTKFDLFYFLYVDDGAMLFNNREDLIQGTNLLLSHFARFGLQMHIGVGDNKSKTECMYFPTFDNKYSLADTTQFDVGEGFVHFTMQFRYLGSTITSLLNDSIDIDARISQASKAMGALRKYFRCKQVSLTAKRLIYLAIPINLVLWGAESWAISEKSMEKLSVFHTRSIRAILGINIYQVQEHHITNESILERINLPNMENLVAKRQLRWLGKIARMDEKRLPLKMLSCWMQSTRPVRRPPTTNRNSLVKSLQLIDPNICDQGILSNWFQTAKDLSEWNDKISTLEPPKRDSVFNFDFLDSLDSDTNPSNDQATANDVHDPLSPVPNIPSPEQRDDSDLSVASGRAEIQINPSHRIDGFEPPENQNAPQTRINSPASRLQQNQDSETCSASTHEHTYPPSPYPALEHFPPDQNNRRGNRDYGSSRYTRHRPPPLDIPNEYENSEDAPQEQQNQQYSSSPQDFDLNFCFCDCYGFVHQISNSPDSNQIQKNYHRNS